MSRRRPRLALSGRSVLLALLDRLGQHATLVLAGGALFGVALPGLSTLARPLLAPMVIALLALALLRVRRDEVVTQVRRPLPALAGAGWLLLGTAPLTALVLGLVGPVESPGVQAGMILMAASAPITAAPTIALMMGLPLGLTLAATLLATVMVPLSVPWLTMEALGVPVSVDAVTLALRLAMVVGGGALLALVLRRRTTPEWRARNGRRLDGVAVILLFGFALAIMGPVADILRSDPARVIGIIALSFVHCGAMMAVTTLIFAPFGRATALGLGYIASSRNMGLLLAGLPAGAAPDVALWFALAQFPLYMLPVLVRPVVRRLTRPPP